MKTFPLTLLFISLFGANCANAAVTCLFKDSVSVTTPDRHCSKKCGGHADAQPIETLTLTMNEEWTKKGAFYRGAGVRCEGGNGCTFKTLGAARTFNSGKSVDATYKTWSIPAKLVLEADVCVIE